jgi:hypothetical protein
MFHFVQHDNFVFNPLYGEAVERVDQHSDAGVSLNCDKSLYAQHFDKLRVADHSLKLPFIQID